MLHEAIHVDGNSPNRTFNFHRGPTKINVLELIDYGAAYHVVQHVEVEHFFFLYAWIIAQEVGF